MSNPSEETPFLNSHHSNYGVPTKYQFDGDETIGTRTATEIENLSDDEATQLEEGTRSSQISTSPQVLNIGIANSPFLVATKNQVIHSEYKGFHGGRYLVENGFSKLQGLKLFGVYTPTDNAESICIYNPARKNNSLAPVAIKEMAAGHVKLYTKWHGAYERYNSFVKAEESSWTNIPKKTKRRLQQFTAEHSKLLSVMVGGAGAIGMTVHALISIGLGVLAIEAKNVATLSELIDMLGQEGDARDIAIRVFTTLKKILLATAVLIPIGGIGLSIIVGGIIAAVTYLAILTHNQISRASFQGKITNINLGPTESIALPEGMENNETPNYVEYQGKYYIVLDEPENIAEKIVQIAETGTEAPAVEISEPKIPDPKLFNPKSRYLGGATYGTSEVKNVHGSEKQNINTDNITQQAMSSAHKKNRLRQETLKVFKTTANQEVFYLKQQNNLANAHDSSLMLINADDRNGFAQKLAEAKNNTAICELIAQVVIDLGKPIAKDINSLADDDLKNVVEPKVIYHSKANVLPEKMRELYNLVYAQAHYNTLMDCYTQIYKRAYPRIYNPINPAPSFTEMLNSIKQNPVTIANLPSYTQLETLQQQQAGKETEIQALAHSPEVYEEFMQFLSTGAQITPSLIKAYCVATSQYCRIWTLGSDNSGRLHYDAANSHPPSDNKELMDFNDDETIDLIYDASNSDLGHFYKAESIDQWEYQRLKPSVSSNANSLFENSAKNRSSSAMLISNLAEIGLTFTPTTKGKGNCLYDAVCFYLQDQDAATLRQVVAAKLTHNLRDYEDFIILPANKTMDDYLKNIGQGEEWASHIEIDILMRLLDRPIVVIEPNNRLAHTSTLDGGRFNGEPIFVYYNGRNHYDGLILNGKKDAQAVWDELRQQQTSSLQLNS